MHKILYFLPLLFLLVACDNELDIIEEWKDIPIVYGVLDPADTAHYIRVEKAFVDAKLSGSALAKIPDSLYYKDIEVQLIREPSGEIVILDRVDGNLEGYPRDSGAFAQLPNYLYKASTADLDLKGNEKVSLYLKRPGEQAQRISTTHTIGNYNFLRPRPDDPEKINLSYANHLTIRWNQAENAVDYEVFIVVHYDEKQKTDPVSAYEPKSVQWKAATNVEGNSVMIESKEFYTFLGSAMESNADLVRRFTSLEFRLLAVGQEVSDYIAIGGANLGITASQEIPQYSNIEGGLGVFSSTWEIRLEGLRMVDASLDSVRYGVFTKQLNFQ